MPTPSLSVAISNYNHAHFLPVALEAILTQSYPATEVIIIDDASTDNSVDVIERYARQYSTLRLIRNRSNMGVLHNANHLLELTSSDYFYSAASDDRVLPGFFEKSMNVLERSSNAALCFSDPATFEETSGPIRINHLGLSTAPCYFTPEELVDRLERREFHIAGTHRSSERASSPRRAACFLSSAGTVIGSCSGCWRYDTEFVIYRSLWRQFAWRRTLFQPRERRASKPKSRLLRKCSNSCVGLAWMCQRPSGGVRSCRHSGPRRCRRYGEIENVRINSAPGWSGELCGTRCIAPWPSGLRSQSKGCIVHGTRNQSPRSVSRSKAADRRPRPPHHARASGDSASLRKRVF